MKNTFHVIHRPTGLGTAFQVEDPDSYDVSVGALCYEEVSDLPFMIQDFKSLCSAMEEISKSLALLGERKINIGDLNLHPDDNVGLGVSISKIKIGNASLYERLTMRSLRRTPIPSALGIKEAVREMANEHFEIIKNGSAVLSSRSEIEMSKFYQKISNFKNSDLMGTGLRLVCETDAMLEVFLKYTAIEPFNPSIKQKALELIAEGNDQ